MKNKRNEGARKRQQKSREDEQEKEPRPGRATSGWSGSAYPRRQT